MEARASMITYIVLSLGMLLITLGNARPNAISESAVSPASASELTPQGCGKQLRPTCQDSVFQFVFNPNKGVPTGKKVVDEDCCKQLLKMGRPCHDLLTKISIRGQDFEEGVDKILTRNDEVWDKCEVDGFVH